MTENTTKGTWLVNCDAKVKYSECSRYKHPTAVHKVAPSFLKALQPGKHDGQKEEGKEGGVLKFILFVFNV